MKALLTNPIVSLSGDEFLPISGMTFAEQVLLFFQQLCLLEPGAKSPALRLRSGTGDGPSTPLRDRE